MWICPLDFYVSEYYLLLISTSFLVIFRNFWNLKYPARWKRGGVIPRIKFFWWVTKSHSDSNMSKNVKIKLKKKTERTFKIDKITKAKTPEGTWHSEKGFEFHSTAGGRYETPEWGASPEASYNPSKSRSPRQHFEKWHADPNSMSNVSSNGWEK